MDQLISDHIRLTVHRDTHPYCIAYGTPVRFYIPRSIKKEDVWNILQSRGHKSDDRLQHNRSNPSSFPAFLQLYNVYHTKTMAIAPDQCTALGEIFMRVPGAALARLGRCVGYDGDMMPVLGSAPPMDKDAVIDAILPLADPPTDPASKDTLDKIRSLMGTLGGIGNLRAALHYYWLYYSGVVACSPIHNTPMVKECDTEPLKRLLQAKWIPCRVRIPPLTAWPKHPDCSTLSFRVPVYAISALVARLGTLPHAFTVASLWPLQYGFDAWRIRGTYFTGRFVSRDNESPLSKEALSIEAEYNTIFYPDQPDDNFQSLYVGVAVAASGPLQVSLVNQIADIADLLYERDKAWHQRYPYDPMVD